MSLCFLLSHLCSRSRLSALFSLLSIASLCHEVKCGHEVKDKDEDHEVKDEDEEDVNSNGDSHQTQSRPKFQETGPRKGFGVPVQVALDRPQPGPVLFPCTSGDGVVQENPIGVWEFRSKSGQNSCSLEGGCRGYIFALEVTEELDSWPEQSKYERKWLTTEEAFKLCRYDWMMDALKKFLTALSTNRMKGTRETLMELPMIPASDTGTENQILSPGCSGKKPSSVQNLEESCTKCVVQV